MCYNAYTVSEKCVNTVLSQDRVQGEVANNEGPVPCVEVLSSSGKKEGGYPPTRVASPLVRAFRSFFEPQAEVVE